MSTFDNLELEIEDIVSKNKNSESKQSVKKSNTVQNNIPMIYGAVLLLGLALYFGWKQKVETLAATPITIVNTAPVAQDEIKAIKDDVLSESDKLVLLGILMNQNTFVTEQGHPKENYVYLNSDWTLSEVPKNLTLDDKTKEFLSKRVKNF